MSLISPAEGNETLTISDISPSHVHPARYASILSRHHRRSPPRSTHRVRRRCVHASRVLRLASCALRLAFGVPAYLRFHVTLRNALNSSLRSASSTTAYRHGHVEQFRATTSRVEGPQAVAVKQPRRISTHVQETRARPFSGEQQAPQGQSFRVERGGFIGREESVPSGSVKCACVVCSVSRGAL